MNQEPIELSLKEITCIAPSVNAIPITLAAIQGAVESVKAYEIMSKRAGYLPLAESVNEAVSFLESWLKALEAVRQEHLHEYNNLLLAREAADETSHLAMNIYEDDAPPPHPPDEDDEP